MLKTTIIFLRKPIEIKFEVQYESFSRYYEYFSHEYFSRFNEKLSCNNEYFSRYNEKVSVFQYRAA